MLYHPKALVLIANGTEEMEAVIIVDILRRAEITVTLTSITSTTPITCSRNILITPDASLSTLPNPTSYNALILPGGMAGSLAFSQSTQVMELTKAFLEDDSKTVGVICAAGLTLLNAQAALNRSVTSHPCIMDKLKDAGYKYSEERVCIDGNLITSRGPGTAFEFALAIVRRLKGEKVEKEVEAPLMLA
ncbi:DJ-1-like protein [Chytridium lagenaria]|nr:DJ-1-like protein [Chytridium lagenaria]